MERVLLIDDDVELCDLLKEYLGTEGFCVDAVQNARRGMEWACEEKHKVIILDFMLPEINGFEVLRHLRGKIATPVIMLTARGEDMDRIIGLELGADDYMPKPFNPRELVARLRAILRRVKQELEKSFAVEKINVGDVEMDLSAHVVMRAGEPVEFTSVEFGFLERLLRNAGKLVSREELVREVLGRPLSPCDRSVDVHISKIRKKLGNEVEGVERIKTIRSSGYLYALTAPSKS